MWPLCRGSQGYGANNSDVIVLSMKKTRVYGSYIANLSVPVGTLQTPVYMGVITDIWIPVGIERQGMPD